MHIQNLRKYRELRGLSQKELAQQSGLSPRAVAGYEAGGGVRPGNARNLAEALDVPIADLVGVDTPKALSLSSPRVRRWLRGHDAKFALMSEGDFAEYAVKQPLDVDHGKPGAIERMLAEIKQEEDALGHTFRREAGNPSEDLWSAQHAPNTGLGRDSESRRFLREDLGEHYYQLHKWLIRYSNELYERGLTSDMLAPTPHLAETWLAEAEAAADAASGYLIRAHSA